MNKGTFLFSIAACAVLLGGSSVARAAVTPMSTFTFDVVGFNLGTSAGEYVVPGETATFGMTMTYPGVGIDMQDITITSSETIGLMTTDTFTVSTPTSFVSDTDLTSGQVINGLQFDLGDPNSGGGAVSLVLPITSYSATGSTIYGTGVSTTTAALTPTTMLGTGGMSYGAAEGVNTTSGNPPTTPAIGDYDVHSFTYSISYPTLPVPEPSTWAMLGLGAIAGAVAVGRRRLAA